MIGTGKSKLFCSRKMQGPVRLPANPQAINPASARFGVFEVDFGTGQVRKYGLKLKLRGKPLQILEALLERPGDLVTREELRAKLWPAEELSVSSEHSLTIAMNKLRTALGDSAGNPRFIET